MCSRMVGSLALVLSVTCSTVAQTQTVPQNSGRTKDRHDVSTTSQIETSTKLNQWNFAIQLVSALADDARNFKDDTLKVQVQARVADVLWNVDRVRARALFERAWEAAEV